MWKQTLHGGETFVLILGWIRKQILSDEGRMQNITSFSHPHRTNWCWEVTLNIWPMVCNSITGKEDLSEIPQAYAASVYYFKQWLVCSLHSPTIRLSSCRSYTVMQLMYWNSCPRKANKLKIVPSARKVVVLYPLQVHIADWADWKIQHMELWVLKGEFLHMEKTNCQYSSTKVWKWILPIMHRIQNYHDKGFK